MIPGPQSDPDAWPELCERFCLHFLVLAEKMRPAMNLLEESEEDPDRLEALYKIDHGVTRMRRAARDLRVLAGRDGESLSGPDTSLLDVVRMAESSIEQYRQVSILRVVDLAVPAYAAEDLASLVAALLDNATRYSPGNVTVSARLLDDGGVMIRIEDSGIGMAPAQLDGLNATLAGPVPPMTGEIARSTGFPVVHRLARRHGVGVRLAARAGGTVAMVTVPPVLLCEIPADEPGASAGPRSGEAFAGMAHLAMARGAERPEPEAATPVGGTATDLGGLPRRERASLRPVGPRPAQAQNAASGGGPAASGAGSFAADLDAFSAGTRRDADEPAAGEREEGRQ
ncbi:ATP-binding protein [Spirillospora sp. NPDC047418]